MTTAILVLFRLLTFDEKRNNTVIDQISCWSYFNYWPMSGEVVVGETAVASGDGTRVSVVVGVAAVDVAPTCNSSVVGCNSTWFPALSTPTYWAWYVASEPLLLVGPWIIMWNVPLSPGTSQLGSAALAHVLQFLDTDPRFTPKATLNKEFFHDLMHIKLSYVLIAQNFRMLGSQMP